MTHLIYLLFFILTIGCHRLQTGDNVFGADEFVIDSYQIKEKNFSNLFFDQKKSTAVSEDLMEESLDQIQEEDRLYVMFIHPVRKDIVQIIESISQSMGFCVSRGCIHLPLIGSIEVEGKTLEEAKNCIEKRYESEIENVEVFVSYKQRATRVVTLIGMVQNPTIAVDGKTRLFDVLAKAKISPNANLYKSYVVRKKEVLPIDLQQLLLKADMSQNIVMRSSDKIYIAPETAANMMVLGEVGQPSVISLGNGYLSLKEVLTRAKGILPTGDGKYIQVFRGKLQSPKVYVLNWEQVMRLPNDSLLVMPGDVVYVATRPITAWNRFVSQILPTFAGFEMLDKGVKQVGVFMQ